MLGLRKKNRIREAKKLEIGSGSKPKKGYIHFDVRSNVKADIIGDARQLPFENLEYDEVYSRFFLEHLPRNDAKKALSEMYRVLKLDGTIELIVPNIAYFCKLFIEEKGQKKEWALNKLYGFENYPEDHHYFGYDYDVLAKYLHEVGFIDIIGVKDQEQYTHIKAKKPKL
ncbi:MAG: methyltransferase domain-containing protein [Candidatus Diapherotrites archaeon]|nr:methyltransferase domain-containing protein [Candidatus Diapherotrites archaeon]